MMNMTKEKLFEETMFARRYTWKKEWVRPYESSFGILLNFCKVNAIEGAKALKLLGKTTSTKCLCDMLVPDDYANKMQMFICMKKDIRNSMMERRIMFCPECRKVGYHSVFHQLFNAKTCIFHKIPLEHDAYDDNDGILYSGEYVCYDREAPNFANARNMPHPSLRPQDTAILSQMYYKYIKCRLIEHICLHACDTYTEFEKLQRERVYPFEFLSNPFLYKRTIIKHFNGSENELLKLLQSGSHPLRAIYEYEQTDLKTATIMDKRHIIFDHLIYLHDYYLYCMFRNLIGDSADNNEFEEINIERADTLSIQDMIKLKLSFIWSVKGSRDWQIPLSFYWVQHPDSFDNYNHRHITNGVIIEDLYLSLHEVPNSYVNAALVRIYILEDLFKLLWQQYIALARRPQGVSVGDGWKELKVPEYYICKNISNNDLYMYRKK